MAFTGAEKAQRYRERQRLASGWTPQWRLAVVGKRFGRLEVLEEVERSRNSAGSSRRVVRVRCDCGVTKTLDLASLQQGTRSCGCLQRDVAAANGAQRATHGRTRGRKQTAIYRVWRGIKDRCCQPTHISFKYYGGRGISLWSAWAESFEKFEHDVLAAIGDRPSAAHSIDRIDNERGYEPMNLRWATRSEQRRNQGHGD